LFLNVLFASGFGLLTFLLTLLTRRWPGFLFSAAIRVAVRPLGLEIRTGLHAGEYKVSGTDLVGLAFHIGARVAAKARAGEILVSRAVKDLMS
jgi:hypothetical protein